MRGEESRWQDLVITWNTCVRTINGEMAGRLKGIQGPMAKRDYKNGSMTTLSKSKQGKKDL